MRTRTGHGWRRSGVTIGLTLGALVGSAAFATWLADGEGQGEARAGFAQELTVERAASVGELFPGGSGDVGVEIGNPNPYPVLVTLVEQVPGTDITTSNAGCDPSNHDVSFSTQSTSISVPAGGSTIANLVDAVVMGLGSADACQGAVFVIDLRVIGGVDDGGGSTSTFYLDADGDGYGDPGTSVESTSAPDGYVDNALDCNDTDAAANPEATEVVGNDIDDDCDGLLAYYQDLDGDGYGSSVVVETTSPGLPDTSPNDLDCDDTRVFTYPGAPEIPLDGVDNDCDGEVDEGGDQTFFADADADGYGTPDDSVVRTSPPAGYVDNDADCDDTRPDVNPGATEVANGIDDDCDGVVDEDTSDFDADGTPDHLDPDDDNDGVLDADDSHPLDQHRCADTDEDGFDDCSSGTFDPSNDGGP